MDNRPIMAKTEEPAYISRLRAGRRPPRGHSGPPAPPAATATVKPKLQEIPRDFAPKLLDADAVRVVRRLIDAGHEAYLVGGCVRDLLFGLRPKDFDVATSATPSEIRRLFRNCRIIGRRFRLAHVFFRDKVLEVATFRAPLEKNHEAAGNGLLIRDDNTFGTAKQDAVRRDFTVNGLFYDVQKSVILDYVAGVKDADKKLLRTIGDPEIRMREDPIRMLRAVRLSSRLGCEIDKKTIKAIENHAAEVLDAAAPRIHEDLLRMFAGGAMAPAFDGLISTGLLEVILPELFDHLSHAVNAGDLDEVEALRAALRIADRWTQSKRSLEIPVRFALLLAPVLLTPLDDASRRDSGGQVADALRPIAQRIALSKRECERLRQILLALDKLVPRKKRRRFSVSALIKRAYFPDALDLFELMTEATGDLREDARRWRQRLEEAFPNGLPEKKKPARRSPRRRRGGREAEGKGSRAG